MRNDPEEKSRESELYIHRSKAGTDENFEDLNGITFSYKEYEKDAFRLQASAREKIFQQRTEEVIAV